MKKLTLSFYLTFVVMAAFAQPSPYTFSTLKNNTHGATEDQCATGTCWSFATVSFLESEILRMKGKSIDLSEMFNVRHVYPQKAMSYVRYQGKQQFGPGGLSHDVLSVLRSHGVVPESAYTGLPSAQLEHNHETLDLLLEGLVKTVLDKKLNEQDPTWINGAEALLDAYLGKLPTTFEFENKSYTPASFRDDLGLNANDYVCLTSFSHHPWHSSFVLEVPDNWSKGSYHNLPLNELQEVANYALNNGHTIAWDADVSEKGFSFKHGMAILPADSVKKENYFKRVITEQKVTPEERQANYEKFSTTDDHLMHITGLAKDQNGTLYYITKNSWGNENPFGGFQYISESYFLMKTVAFVVHKDALPEKIKKKLNL